MSTANGAAIPAAFQGSRLAGYLLYALTLSLALPAAILLVLLVGARRRRVALT